MEGPASINLGVAVPSVLRSASLPPKRFSSMNLPAALRQYWKVQVSSLVFGPSLQVSAALMQIGTKA